MRIAGGGSLRGVADANGEGSGMVNGDRELMAGVDIVYLKNVLLKFLDAATAGRFDQVHLPIASAVLHVCICIYSWWAVRRVDVLHFCPSPSDGAVEACTLACAAHARLDSMHVTTRSVTLCCRPLRRWCARARPSSAS